MCASQGKPSHRRLRGYAFDPSLSLLVDTVEINNIVYRVRWEEEGFGEGPVGEYLEVVDYDPTVQQFYPPVDLNDPYVLANDGLEPSESNPQFHQQMVYAVSMLTIQNFERALGRKILWAPRQLADRKKYEEYVPKLRIYPHALREANAYYSPLKKAVLFGYFAAAPENKAKQMPGSLVFTCLSHDIIAHEVTHAILDGHHRYYNVPSNPDVLAFHEAFADLVALFQHFTFPEVLKHQIAKTKGDLEKQNLLGELAQQFGVAIGNYGSLRDALGKVNEKTKEWEPEKPDPTDYENTTEPHKRGSILVAAVFEAFLTIYKRRVSDLLRISTGGSGILPAGDLHPDLVNRLADEASKTADHVLRMCIRAIDYCPPVDINFGDFLRAIITADSDLVVDDGLHYRLAFVEAFRRRGIYPEGIKSLSVESLDYEEPVVEDSETKRLLGVIVGFLKEYREALLYVTARERTYDISRDFMGGRRGGDGRARIQGLHERLTFKFGTSFEFERLTGLVFNNDYKNYGVRTAGSGNGPSFQVLDLRLVSRVGPDGEKVNQIIFGLVQRMGLVFKDGEFEEHYVPDNEEAAPAGGFEVRGGCTLIFDLDSVQLKHAISKPLFRSDKLDRGEHKVDLRRIGRQHKYLYDELPLSQTEVSNYFGAGAASHFGEPFSLLHRR